MEEQERKRVVKKPSAASKMVTIPEPLDDGDTIEYGNTGEIRSHSGNFWPKVTATTKVRPGETSQDALDRIAEFVNDNLAEAMAALK